MKPTSPLSLLLFLQLSSATPLPQTPFPSDCQHTSCADFPAKPHTPSTHFSNPFFPSHQLSSPDLDDVTIDNRPYTPTKDTPASIALTSDRPLSSSFLLSLTNPASSPSIQKSPISPSSTNSLPAKPTSALPALRLEDARKYWASLRAVVKDGETLGSDGPRHKVQFCGAGTVVTSHYSYVEVRRVGRDYSDLMVVGIVMLFLVAVVGLEVVERVGSLSATFLGRPRPRRGEIFLEDDESVAFIVKKPVECQSDAMYDQIATNEYGDEKEGLAYDSDAYQRV